MRKANERDKEKSFPSLGSDLARVDAHQVTAAEYEELPELTDEMLARATVNKGGRTRARGESRSDWARVRATLAKDANASAENAAIGALIANRKPGRPIQGEAKEAISLRIPVSVLERWRATGKGWQTRMAELLSKAV